MRQPYRVFIILIVVLAVAPARSALAQQPDSKCAQVKFSEPLTGASLYRLKSVEGQAVYGAVGERGEFQGANGLCVALFNSKSKRLIAGILTDNGGQFKFAEVAPDKYVLIVSVSELHNIVVPMEVASGTRAASFKHWELMLHLRSKEDRKKSFVTPITQSALRAELLKLYREDQAVRDQIIQRGSDQVDKSIDARRMVLDAGSTVRMKAIVKRHGWPGPDLVGADGANAAFILLQHSQDLAFQQAMLPLVRRSYVQGKLTGWNYALLVDRLLIRQGKRQRYGMSLEPWTGNEPIVAPIEDEANVDKRRAKIGLPPLRDYLEQMKQIYFPQH
jgi:hypothetical protein